MATRSSAQSWVRSRRCGQAEENCPVFPGTTSRRHVPFDDPPKLAETAVTEEEALGHYRRVRDEIKVFIPTLSTLMELE